MSAMRLAADTWADVTPGAANDRRQLGSSFDAKSQSDSASDSAPWCLQSLAVDLGSLGLFAWLVRGDLKARDKQVPLMHASTGAAVDHPAVTSSRQRTLAAGGGAPIVQGCMVDSACRLLCILGYLQAAWSHPTSAAVKKVTQEGRRGGGCCSWRTPDMKYLEPFFCHMVMCETLCIFCQVARLQREEKLGALQLELANRKVLRLADLRSFSRVVNPTAPVQISSAALKLERPDRPD